MIGCSPQSTYVNPTNFDKINGISLVASKNPLIQENIIPITNVNANYVAIMPFGFIQDLSNPFINFNSEHQWYGETKDGIKQYTAELKKNEFKLMLKPQIWVWQGEFTGNIKMESEEDWTLLETSYSQFILEFAVLAQELNIELFCIGTELEQFVLHRPEYWIELIEEIKQVYNGMLTYAANWNEFEKVPFWQEIDYIGIDAYFPIDDKKTPSVQDCRLGWNDSKWSIEKLSLEKDKPILFTEYGYRSVDFTANEPWNSDRKEGSINLTGQLNALEALLEEFWLEDWFAGGFIWKWHMNHMNSGGDGNNRFTPQNKPAENVLKEYYSLNP